ncbi:MAG: (Fe-S)-binding protein [Desulfobacterales bacterium]
MNLEAAYEEIARCNRCGFCQAACPVFRATASEAGVARGRIALLRALIEGRIAWDAGLEGPLFDCLLCGACTAACFPAVPTAELLVRARSAYLARVGRKAAHRLLFDRLLPDPRRLRRAARAAAIGKRSGLSRLAAALGLLRAFGRDLGRAEEILPAFPRRAFREELAAGAYDGAGNRGTAAYFVGCGVDLLHPAVGRASLALLRERRRRVLVLDNNCCGLPAWSAGDLGAARRLAAANLALLNDPAVEAVVTDCSSCASFLRSYPRLFPPPDPRHGEARRLAAKTFDLAPWLHAEGAPSAGGLRGRRITFHDPCHAARGLGVRREPREILGRIPGAEFVELPEADACCGGAGSYALSHYDLAMRVLERKTENLERTGADLLVTTCPACMIQLAHGVRRAGLAVEVRHLAQVLRPTPPRQGF